LTSLLRRHDPEVTVSAVTVGHTWQGTTSHLHLDVSYADPHPRLPQRLFIKTQLRTVHDLPEAFDESLSEGGGGTVLYDDETRFYRDLRPALNVETMTTYFRRPPRRSVAVSHPRRGHHVTRRAGPRRDSRP
jgi:hypothetical protein